MAEEEAAVTRDSFLGGRLTALQPKAGYRAAVDPVLLAAAADARPGQSALDLGCGTGIMLLCLCGRVTGLSAHGLEIYPPYAALARRNAAANGFRIRVWEGNAACPPKDLRQFSFDWVLANPPYRRPGEGPLPADAGRRSAETESAPLSAWVGTAAQRLRPGGRLAMIVPPARLKDLLACLPETLGSIRIKPIRSRPGREAKRILLKARNGGRSGLQLAPALILHNGSGTGFSRDAEAVLRDGAPLVF